VLFSTFLNFNSGRKLFSFTRPRAVVISVSGR
jgi:hypothetical protein